jgi:N-dimethylarginine dimethylaminohydrolase
VDDLQDIAGPPFESADEQERLWGRRWGCDSEVGRLRVVLMHPPTERSLRADPLSDLEPVDGSSDAADEGWYWAPGECIARDQLPFARMLEQWQHLVDVLRSEGVEVVTPQREGGGRFICYPRDPILPVKGGVVIGRLPGQTRRGEERWATATVANLGIPIIRTVTGTGMMEGGSFAWINHATAAVGRSNCVNEEGTRQVEQIVNSQDAEMLRVDLSFNEIHLDGVFSMIDVNLALVDLARVPFTFLEALSAQRVKVIPLGEHDDRWVINCLAIRPGTIVMPQGLSPETRAQIEGQGVAIITIAFDAMQENGGGIRCATSPLARDPIPEPETTGV